jgi:protein phosphatase 2C family protein 2/3
MDPMTGQLTEIKSLTVLNIDSMVKDACFTDGSAHFEIQPGQRIVIPNHEQTKCSFKRNGIVRAYAANTN